MNNTNFFMLYCYLQILEALQQNPKDFQNISTYQY